MKKFRFTLRSVAVVRSIRELRAREQFSIAVGNVNTAEAQLTAARERVAQLEQRMRAGREGSFRAGDQLSFIRAYQAETTACTKAAANLDQARSALEAARQNWLTARRDVRVTDNLEQKARFAHRRQSEREDQAAMDDRTGALAMRAATNAL